MSYDWRISDIDIIDSIVSIDGFFEKVFWKLLPKLVFDRAIQNDIHIIKRIYQMKDIDTLFDAPVDRKEFKKLSKIIFRFQENVKPSIIWPSS